MPTATDTVNAKVPFGWLDRLWSSGCCPSEHYGWVNSGVLVGRESSLASLRDALVAARWGRGGFGLVAGEAGIGKTALVANVAEYAAGLDFEVLWATCWDGDGAPPFWPWVQVLRAHEAGLGPLRPVLAGPPVAGWSLSDLVSPESGRSVRDSNGERFALFDAVSSQLLQSARSRPLMVIVDDLQWADTPSLLLLNFLARQVQSAPLLLVGIFRDDEVSADQVRGPLLAQARGQAQVIALTGLAAGDVEKLIGSIPGMGGPALAAAVWRRSGGNPFFIREVTQLLLSRAGPDGEPIAGAIPDGVRQVVDQRLARLPQGCVSVLTVAAVAGREISGDLLARVTGLGVEQVARRLAPAVRARMLADPPGPGGPFRFVHDLIRETVCAGLTPGALAELHRRIGRALQAAQAAGSVVHAAELAEHFLLATAGSDADDQLAEDSTRYGLLAAAEAIARLAYEDAAGHLRRQLDGLGAVGRLREPDRLRLLLARADAFRRAGDQVAAHADYAQALPLARRSADTADLAQVAVGVHALGVKSGAPRTAVVDLLEEAVDGVGADDTELTARVLAALARELFLSGPADRVRSGTLSSAAVQMARRAGNEDALAVALLAAHDTRWLPGMAQQRQAIAVEMGIVARRAGDRGFEAEACLLRALARLEAADPAALSDLAEFSTLGVATGQPHDRYLVLTRRAALATMTGHLADAERVIEQAGVLAERTGEPDAWNVQTRLWWRLRSLQGRRPEEEQRLRSVSNHLLKFWFDAQLGLTLLEGDNRPEALHIIGSALLTRPEELAFPYVLTAQWAELGEAAAAAGLVQDCRRFYNALRPYAGNTVVTAAVVSFDGAVDHHLGVLAAAMGRRDDAVRHLEDAAAVHERLSAWPWLAWSQCELAAVLSVRDAPGDRSRVIVLLDVVGRAAAELNLPGLARKAARIGLRPLNMFSRDGDGWLISYAGQQIQLRNVKGLGDIAALLSAPGRAIPATALTAAGPATGAEYGGDPILDRTALQQYRSRLAALDVDIEDATTGNDLVRRETLVAEREFLTREMSAAVGLGGRDRRLGDDRERARKAVAGRIKDALTRINTVHPALADHLSRSISTGYLCAYRPDRTTRWAFTDPDSQLPEQP